jgi:hypothetical protein
MSSEMVGSNEAALSRALLEPEGADLGRDARRFLSGLSLAGVFGLALGSRFGAASMAAHAVGVPLGIALVVLLATPAFYVGVLHGGVELEARALASTMARGVATAGLCLAGLAPAMALFALSAEASSSVAWLAWLGLTVAGFLGQRATFRALPREAPLSDWRVVSLRFGFAVFAALLAWRIWWLVLPIFGGQP